MARYKTQKYTPLFIYLALIILVLSFNYTGLAQGTYLPLGHDTYHYIERLEIKSGLIDMHLSSKPVNRFGFQPLFTYKRLAETSQVDNENFGYLISDNPIGMKTETGGINPGLSEGKPILKHFYKRKSSLFFVDDQDFELVVNPVIYFQYGKEFNFSENKYINSRGLELRGIIEDKIGFYVFVTDNQMQLPEYIKSKIAIDQAVPGEGFYKYFKNTSGVDFFTARGYFTFHVAKPIGIQIGHDKNFLGNGYRSLILSDYANSYFFLKVSTKVWKLKYQNLFCELTSQHIRWGDDTLRPKKYAVFHHLSYNIFRNFNIGLFEAVIFSRKNTFEFHYLNPIIFYRAVEQNLGSPDNAFMGLDYKFNFLKHFSLYGQVVLDELNFQQFRENPGWWGNKFGIQSGLKYIDVAGISNMDAQIEYNIVRPFTYTYAEMHSNLTHYNQPLAHPLGANFNELIGIIRCQPFQKINITAKLITALHGSDSIGRESWTAFRDDTANVLTTNGGNIFVSYNKRKMIHDNSYRHSIGQGIKDLLFLVDVVISYQVKHNLFFDLKLIYRDFNSELDIRDQETNFIGIAIRLNVPQRTDDY